MTDKPFQRFSCSTSGETTSGKTCVSKGARCWVWISLPLHPPPAWRTALSGCQGPCLSNPAPRQWPTQARQSNTVENSMTPLHSLLRTITTRTGDTPSSCQDELRMQPNTCSRRSWQTQQAPLGIHPSLPPFKSPFLDGARLALSQVLG